MPRLLPEPTAPEVKTQAVKWDGRANAVDLTLPGMSAMFFLFKPAQVESNSVNSPQFAATP